MRVFTFVLLWGLSASPVLAGSPEDAVIQYASEQILADLTERENRRPPNEY
jgi:hypothetical protein